MFDRPNRTSRIVQLENAKSLEDHENSGSAEGRDIIYKEIGKNIELPHTQNGFITLDNINNYQEIQ